MDPNIPYCIRISLTKSSHSLLSKVDACCGLAPYVGEQQLQKTIDRDSLGRFGVNEAKSTQMHSSIPHITQQPPHSHTISYLVAVLERVECQFMLREGE